MSATTARRYYGSFSRVTFDAFDVPEWAALPSYVVRRAGRDDVESICRSIGRASRAATSCHPDTWATFSRGKITRDHYVLTLTRGAATGRMRIAVPRRQS